MLYRIDSFSLGPTSQSRLKGNKSKWNQSFFFFPESVFSFVTDLTLRDKGKHCLELSMCEEKKGKRVRDKETKRDGERKIRKEKNIDRDRETESVCLCVIESDRNNNSATFERKKSLQIIVEIFDWRDHCNKEEKNRSNWRQSDYSLECKAQIPLLFIY